MEYYDTDIRTGNGYDVHRLERGLPLWICGVRIESEKGCVAHSDGDTPIHALCDALLGALALGDIGSIFPNTYPEYKNIDSKILLSETCQIVAVNGYELINADITVVLQTPKLAPYIADMRKTLASVLNCPVSAISVKATTTEFLGFIGREEGIAAYASVTLRTKNRL